MVALLFVASLLLVHYVLLVPSLETHAYLSWMTVRQSCLRSVGASISQLAAQEEGLPITLETLRHHGLLGSLDDCPMLPEFTITYEAYTGPMDDVDYPVLVERYYPVTREDANVVWVSGKVTLEKYSRWQATWHPLVAEKTSP